MWTKIKRWCKQITILLLAFLGIGLAVTTPWSPLGSETWLEDYDYRKAINITAADPQEQTVYAFTTDDSDIRANGPNTNYGSELYLSIREGGAGTNRIILEFDISDYSGLTVTEYNLKLYYYLKGGDPSGGIITAYKIIGNGKAWTEAGVTYNEYNKDQGEPNDWHTAGLSSGNDYVTSSPASASDTVPGSYGEMTWDITAIAEDAIASESNIIRVVLISDDTDVVYFRSGEYTTDLTKRPKIEIVGTPSTPSEYKITVDVHAGSPTLEEGTWSADGESCTWRIPFTITTLDAISTGHEQMIVINTKRLVDGGFTNGSAASAATYFEFNNDNSGSPNAPMDYWVQSHEGSPVDFNTDSTRFWVELPSQAASTTETYYMYGSNAIDGVSGNYGGAKVFAFFTDFDVVPIPNTLAGFLATYDEDTPTNTDWEVDTADTDFYVSITDSVLRLDGGSTAWEGIAATAFTQTDFRALFKIHSTARDFTACGMMDSNGMDSRDTGMILWDYGTTYELRRYHTGGDAFYEQVYYAAPFIYEVKKFEALYNYNMWRSSANGYPDVKQVEGDDGTMNLAANDIAHKPIIASSSTYEIYIDWVAIAAAVELAPLVNFPDILYSEDGVIFCEDNCEHFPYDVAFTDDNGSTQLYQWADPLTELTKQPGDSKEFTVKTVTGNDIYIYYGNSDVDSEVTHGKISGVQTFNKFDTFANASQWSSTGGTWSVEDIPMPIIRTADVGNVEGGAGRLWARFPQVIKKGTDDYRCIFTQAGWEWSQGSWPVPYQIFTSSATSPEGPWTPGKLLMSTESGITNSVVWSPDEEVWVLSEVSRIWTATDPDGPWTLNSNGLMLPTTYMSRYLFYDDFTVGDKAWYYFCQSGSVNWYVYKCTNLNPATWKPYDDGSPDWILQNGGVAVLVTAAYSEDCFIVKDPDTDMVYFYHTQVPAEEDILYQSLNTSLIDFPGDNANWTAQGVVTLSRPTVGVYVGSPRLLLEDGDWYFYHFAQWSAGTNSYFYTKWIPNYIYAHKGTLPNTWAAENTEKKYYQSGTAAEAQLSWITSGDYGDIEIVMEVISKPGSYVNYVGILFRYDSANNNGYVGSINYNTATPRLSLHRIDGGATTQIGSYVNVPLFPLPRFTPGYSWRLRIRVYGDEITLAYSPWGNEWVDAMTEADGQYFTGKVGVRGYQSQFYIDDFRVKEYVEIGQIVGEGQETGVIPTVDTLSVTGIGATYATYNGNITYASSGDIGHRGFVWHTSNISAPSSSTSPSDSDFDYYWTESGSFSEGTYNHLVTTLSGSTTYYARACAYSSTNNYWAYGDAVELETLAAMRRNVPISPGGLIY